MKTPEDYCNDYVETATLRNFAPVQDARKSCIDLYRRVLEATTLICNFIKDSEIQSFEERWKAQTNSTQREAFQNLSTLTQKAREKVVDYKNKALFIMHDSTNENDRKITDKGLNSSYRESKQKLGILVKTAGEILKEEIHCQKNGRAGAPNHYILSGLSVRALDDQAQVYKNIRLELDVFINHLNELLSGINHLNNESNRRLRSSQSPVSEFVKDRDAGDPAIAAARSAAQRFALRPFSDAFSTHIAESSLGKVIAGEVLKRGGKAIFGTSTGYLIKFIHGGQPDMLDLASLGVGITTAALGVSFGPATVAAISAAALTEFIRYSWQEEERKVAAPFLEFTKTYFQTHPDATSDQVARAYAEKKRQSPFCGKCGNANSSPPRGPCPAKNSFNDDWFDSSSPFGTFDQKGNRLPSP